MPDAGHVLAPESPKHEKPFPGPHEKEVPDSTAASIATDADVDGRLPTAEERKSLRLVAAKLPKTAYLICLIEFAERASYFGCVVSPRVQVDWEFQASDADEKSTRISGPFLSVPGLTRFLIPFSLTNSLPPLL